MSAQHQAAMNKSIRVCLPLVFVSMTIVLLVGFFPADAIAQTIEDNTSFTPLNDIATAMRTFQGTLNALFINTFWLLASIEIAFAMLMLALHDEGIQGFFRELVIRIMFIGFFLALYNNGIAWTDAIIRTLHQTGSAAAGTSTLSPDTIIDLGIDLMKRSAFEFSIWDAGSSFALLIAAVITFIALLIIAANFALVLAEFYIVGFGGIFLLALGGSRWTRDYALAYLRYVFSAGMRIFIMLVVAGVGYNVLNARIGTMEVDALSQWWAVLGFAVILAILASRAPNAITGMLSGVSNSAAISATQALRATTTVAGAAVGAGAAVAGGAAAASAAGQLGAAQARSASTSTAGRLGRTAANTATNLFKAAGQDMMGSIQGTNKPGSVFPGNSGTMGGRMAANMKEQLGKQKSSDSKKS